MLISILNLIHLFNTFFADEFDEALLRADDELLFEWLLPAVVLPPVDCSEMKHMKQNNRLH